MWHQNVTTKEALPPKYHQLVAFPFSNKMQVSQKLNGAGLDVCYCYAMCNTAANAVVQSEILQV